VTKRSLLIVLRLFFGLLTLTAMSVQISRLVERGAFRAVNFFSYFTNLSNLFAAVVFITGATYLLTHRKQSVRDDVIRGAAALYLAAVGIVYVTLLSAEDLGLLIPWVNVVLHYLMPLVVVFDWLCQPPQTRLVFRQTLSWLVFPFLYLVYVLIRGSIVGWYPYPFLDPAQAGGYGGVSLYSLGICVAFAVIGGSLMTLGNKLQGAAEAASTKVARP
jgi:hypothetical protein